MVIKVSLRHPSLSQVVLAVVGIPQFSKKAEEIQARTSVPTGMCAEVWR